MKRLFFIPFLLLSAKLVNSQVQFSLATDLGLQRSFKKEQRYWAGGHTVHGIFNVNRKDAVYAWISYYSNGKFKNDLVATARSPLTIPQQISYVNNAEMRFKHLSFGYRRYLKGAIDADEGWNLYASAGFGLLLGRVVNTQIPNNIDSTVYFKPVRDGKANFKRLTLDLSLGWEVPLGAQIYFYTEGRIWVPTSDYPSKFIFVNENAPLVGMLNFGVRILFD